MKKILVIEDDNIVSKEIKVLLDSSGFEGILLKDFKNAIDEVFEVNPDLILMDINIPFINGEMLLKEIRKKSEVPIIMLTSKNNEMDEALSMSFGADDYVTKPYNPTILILRIQRILKRIEGNSTCSRCGELTFNISKGIIEREGIETILTKNEMIIFSHLVDNKERIVSRDELMTALWDNDEYVNDNALTVNISRLRTKLQELGCDDMIKTRKGQGYILETK